MKTLRSVKGVVSASWTTIWKLLVRTVANNACKHILSFGAGKLERFAPEL